MNKKLAALGVAAGLTVGGATGFVLAAPTISGAQSSTDSTAPADSSTKPDPSSRIADALKPLVDNGTLTQDQADKVAEALKGSFPGGGPHGRGGPGVGLVAAASALGISADDLRTAIQGGQTIAQIAQSKGVDLQKVIDALVAEAKTHLDEQVSSGKLTQEQADRRLTELKDRITDLVNNPLPAGPPEGRGPRGQAPGGSNGSSSSSSGSGGSVQGSSASRSGSGSSIATA